MPSGNLVNTATATSSTPDPDPGNNSSTAVTTIGTSIPMLTPPLLGLLALLLAAGGSLVRPPRVTVRAGKSSSRFPRSAYFKAALEVRGSSLSRCPVSGSLRAFDY